MDCSQASPAFCGGRREGGGKELRQASVHEQEVCGHAQRRPGTLLVERSAGGACFHAPGPCTARTFPRVLYPYPGVSMSTAAGDVVGPRANQSMKRVEPGCLDTRTKEPLPPTLCPLAPDLLTEPRSAFSRVDLPTLERPMTGISVQSGSGLSGPRKSDASPR